MLAPNDHNATQSTSLRRAGYSAWDADQSLNSPHRSWSRAPFGLTRAADQEWKAGPYISSSVDEFLGELVTPLGKSSTTTRPNFNT